MKIAIKVLTEWDRENVIPFFEKHYPKCNHSVGAPFSPQDVTIGDIWYIKNGSQYNYLTFEDDNENYLTPSDYTILQGVPQNMELPKVEPTKSREQELEECLSDYITLSSLYGSTSESNYTIQLDNLTDKAKQLLNQ